MQELKLPDTCELCFWVWAAKERKRKRVKFNGHRPKLSPPGSTQTLLPHSAQLFAPANHRPLVEPQPAIRDFYSSRLLTNRKHWVVTEILKKARIYTPPSVDTAANASAKNEAPLSSTSQGSV
ncbi:hypothetical protein GOBAR_DD17306 [Gossypium barbadense]|nr:hypothetical protein GOBAR_DD17306 [Gossypium barbadense]